MELYFNELSTEGTPTIQYKDMQRLGMLYRELKEKGINTCRISDKEYTKIFSQLDALGQASRIFREFLLSFFQPPYETDDVEEKQDEYLSHQWTCNGRDCYGLALAFLMDTMAVSMISDIWNRPDVQILMDLEGKKVRNLYDTGTFEVHKRWLEELEPIQLIKCSIPVSEKQIKLRDDHGSDILLAFGKRIIHNEYVCGIVNSIEFHSGQRKFLHKIENDGIIEIVLPWTDAGFGMAVRTTGRNIRETRAIGEILKEKYGKK